MYEARYIAAHINRLLREGLTVQDGGKARPARRKDFCILLRGVKGRANTYVQELARCGVPAWAELSGGFFDTTEIRTMLSLLRILDNPLQDVPVLGVLFSPIYGFTPDEAAAAGNTAAHAALPLPDAGSKAGQPKMRRLPFAALLPAAAERHAAG